MFYLAVLFRQATLYLAELYYQIAFLFYLTAAMFQYVKNNVSWTMTFKNTFPMSKFGKTVDATIVWPEDHDVKMTEHDLPALNSFRRE